MDGCVLFTIVIVRRQQTNLVVVINVDQVSLKELNPQVLTMNRSLQSRSNLNKDKVHVFYFTRLRLWLLTPAQVRKEQRFTLRSNQNSFIPSSPFSLCCLSYKIFGFV